jgi:hypothetical protein
LAKIEKPTDEIKLLRRELEAAQNAPRTGPNPEVIKGIKELPAGAKLTPEQIAELNKNIDVILNKTLPAKAASQAAKTGGVQDVVDLFKNDPRFRFLDQVPGSRERINDALRPHGAKLD